MGKGRALLVLLGLGGLLLALPGAMKKNGAQAKAVTSKPERLAEGGPVRAKTKVRPEQAKGDLAFEITAGMQAQESQQQQQALEILLPELIKRDIHAAAETVANLESWSPLKEVALASLAREWGRADADAALLWSKQLQDPAQRSHCTRMICCAVAESDPERSVRLVENAGDLLDLSAMSELVAGWVVDSPKAAGEWIEGRSPEERDRFWNLGVQVLAGRSPEKAAILAVERMSPGPLQDEAVISALHQWVLRDRKAAAEWVDLFPEGPLRERAEGELFGTN